MFAVNCNSFHLLTLPVPGETADMIDSSGIGNMFSLAGRTAIVTGAATGIGQAIAIRLVAAVQLRGEFCV